MFRRKAATERLGRIAERARRSERSAPPPAFSGTEMRASVPDWIANDPDHEPITIVTPPHILQQRRAFVDLPPDERIDEIERHMWSLQDPERPKTVHSAALASMGIGVGDD